MIVASLRPSLVNSGVQTLQVSGYLKLEGRGRNHVTPGWGDQSHTTILRLKE
jgi:hypothetical protein